MAHTKDCIPGPDGGPANLTAYMDAKTAGGAWTHLPAEKVSALKGRGTAWYTAYAKTAGPRTAVDTETKNDARAAAGGFVRLFVQ